jgi:anti-sigma regulatory factor (Ser/Thr protein kinase)
VSAARGFLRSALSDLGLTETSGDLIDLLVMAANELVTNAVLHARTEFTIRVLADPTRVRVEVSDANPRMPQPSPAPAHATSGRGLAIIDGSGMQWGVDPHPDGKTMWLQATR